MVDNYIKIAWRSLATYKAYAFINIIGLAVGMAVALLNGLWVWDELSFNHYHQSYDRLALVMTHERRDGKTHYTKSVSYPLANEIKTNYTSQFKQTMLALPQQEYVLSAGQTRLTKVGQFIEAAAPDMLSLKIIKGSPTALNDPHSLLISASTAQALLSQTDPIGQVVTINATMTATIRGVYEDLPANSDFHPVQFFAPWDLYASNNPGVKSQDWNNNAVLLYAQLKPSTNFNQVSTAIQDAKLKPMTHLEGMSEQIASHPQVFLLPMSDWHLYGQFNSDHIEEGPAQAVWLVGLIGCFVLLLACINFINMATARSQKRAKEVGVRKAIGSSKSQLIGQFLTESLLMVGFAFLLALLFASISLGSFNAVAAKAIRVPWLNGYFWLISLSFIGLTALLAGSYPALYLSSFQPIQVLKGNSSTPAHRALGFQSGQSAFRARKVLVVAQFAISVSLIISTVVVYRQVLFAQNRPVGYRREGLLLLEMKSPDAYGKYDLLRSELLKTGVVTDMAESSGQLTEAYIYSNAGGFSWKGKDPGLKTDFGTLSVTPTYGKTVGWQLVAGHDFSGDETSESTSIIINQAAAKLMGMAHPVGELLRWDPGWQKPQSFHIIGVIKDMVMTSPYQPTQPITYRLEGDRNWINIRLNPLISAGEALPKIEAVFKQFIPASPFDYRFADQAYGLKFAAEQRIGTLAALFAGLAIFISCLGLLGLASFTAQQRQKEISIRKVLGASVFSLWRLLTKDFVFLVLIALALASPLTYYWLRSWLQAYAYHTDLSWWIFAVAGVSVLLVTLLTVSYQAIRAAFIDPVKSLRSD